MFVNMMKYHTEWHLKQCSEVVCEEEVLRLWNWLNDRYITRRSLPTREELIVWFNQFKKK